MQVQQDLPRSSAGFWNDLTQRIRQGNIGALPVLIGLLLIAIVFQLLNSKFLSPLNLTNLMVQISAFGTISVGIVLVLLLGEIDLSIGAVSGLCAAIMAVLIVKQGLPAWLAIIVAIVVGTLIGLLQGFWTAKLHVPSFVVSLAGLLGWQGAQLAVLGSTGSINMGDPLIVGIANTRLPVWLGVVLGLVFVGAVTWVLWREHHHRIETGMSSDSASSVGLRIGIIAAAVIGAIAVMSINRSPTEVVIQGVPSAVLIFIGFIVLFDFITRRTRFGRYIFAVGGNIEAARRAGINVDRIRIAVFALCSTMAACGGILAASRLYAVNQQSGGGDVLLNSIAAAVIGGTSLFGGRGNVWSALLGALVIGSIANGMDLLGLGSSTKFMITGAVLLAAVTIDAYARTRREASGR